MKLYGLTVVSMPLLPVCSPGETLPVGTAPTGMREIIWFEEAETLHAAMAAFAARAQREGIAVDLGAIGEVDQSPENSLASAIASTSSASSTDSTK